MIKPINNHVLIQPLKVDSFVFTEGRQHDEVGTVLDHDKSIKDLKKGTTVFFDSWMCAKYTNKNDKDNPYWLVKYEDIRAIENDKQSVSK